MALMGRFSDQYWGHFLGKKILLNCHPGTRGRPRARLESPQGVAGEVHRPRQILQDCPLSNADKSGSGSLHKVEEEGQRAARQADSHIGWIKLDYIKFKNAYFDSPISQSVFWFFSTIGDFSWNIIFLTSTLHIWLISHCLNLRILYENMTFLPAAKPTGLVEADCS